MGDGQFDGGGSVTWAVRNSDGEYLKCARTEAFGKDRDPKGDGAMFRVLVNGQLAVLVPVAGARIQIQWGPDATKPIKKKVAVRRTAAAKKTKPARDK